MLLPVDCCLELSVVDDADVCVVRAGLAAERGPRVTQLAQRGQTDGQCEHTHSNAHTHVQTNLQRCNEPIQTMKPKGRVL